MNFILFILLFKALINFFIRLPAGYPSFVTVKFDIISLKKSSLFQNYCYLILYKSKIVYI